MLHVFIFIECYNRVICSYNVVLSRENVGYNFSRCCVLPINGSNPAPRHIPAIFKAVKRDEAVGFTPGVVLKKIEGLHILLT